MLSLSETFDSAQWAAVVQGQPVDPESLLAWRLQPPPRPPLAELSPRAPLGWSFVHVTKYIPVKLVAEIFHVETTTIRARCRRWGIPICSLAIGGGGPWGRRGSFLTPEALRVLTVKSVRRLGDGSRSTSRATSAPSTDSP